MINNNGISLSEMISQKKKINSLDNLSCNCGNTIFNIGYKYVLLFNPKTLRKDITAIAYLVCDKCSSIFHPDGKDSLSDIRHDVILKCDCGNDIFYTKYLIKKNNNKIKLLSDINNKHDFIVSDTFVCTKCLKEYKNNRINKNE